MERGALIRVHRGVYRAGHTAPSREATYLAAVEACGPGSLLAGKAAAHLWGSLRGKPPPPEVPTASERRVPVVTVRRARRTSAAARPRAALSSGARPPAAVTAGVSPSAPDSAGVRPPAPVGAGNRPAAPVGAGVRSVAPFDATVHRGIPVTQVPRTVVDLAASLPIADLTRACHEADVRYGVGPDQIEAVLSRRSNAAGARTLRRIFGGGEPVTLSALERRFLQRLRESRLPLPETNQPAGGRRVDCRWPAQRLTVELDGYRYQRSRHAWELDRQREREARARGDEFRRYTYADVVEAPRLMLDDLGKLLAIPRLS